MQETEKKITQEMEKVLPMMTEREKDRLLGFVEGLGFNMETKAAQGPAA